MDRGYFVDKPIKITQFFYDDADIEKIGELYCGAFLSEEIRETL